LLLWQLACGCSVLVDRSELESGCGAGRKGCEITPGEISCVSNASAEFGCSRESCVPCTLPQAIEVCGGDGECAVGTCEAHYENCDLMSENGCEVDLDTSYANCGSCGINCDDALRGMEMTVSARCVAGRCAVGTCLEGHADCDSAASNGCETTFEPEDCGRCNGCPTGTICDQATGRCE
jgi:hypothetical protein